MDVGIHPLSRVLQDYALRIPVEWLVSLVLLTSMMLQLVLAVLGARRYKSSSGFFRFVVWGAYISADAVAISALGTMTHSARSGIYGIWAPLLLLHLGGPDAITAYSIADNELWLRHGFTMVYQVSVATYILYSSTLRGSALASAILLLVAGTTKYAERTLALWFASYSQIVKSCLPISKYIKESSYIHRHGYVVMGEKKLQRMIEKTSSSEARQEAPSLEGRGIITLVDLQNFKIEGKDYNLCFSHALFKMYKRRFVNLYFDEGEWKRTRTVWFAFTGKEAFGIVEMELKFMYDAFFSKWSGTMFTKWGVLVRLVNTTLMGAVGFMILRKSAYREAQRTVTYIVIAVALLVELFQLCQMMISDWTRVGLICAHVDEIRHDPHSQSALKWCRICRQKVIEIALLVLGKVRDVVRGDRYQCNKIQQHCFIQTWINRPPLLWKKVGLKPDNFIISGYIKLRHIHTVSVQEELKDFIFNILRVRCSVQNDIDACRDRIYNFEEDLFTEEAEVRNVWLLNGNLQEVILIWHIAATICDNGREEAENNNNLRLSRILSRYCVYLLLSHPNLLPLHPDMARIAYVQVVEQLSSKGYIGKDPRDLIQCKDEGILGRVASLARWLMEQEDEERWKLLANYWGGLVIYMAVYNKAPFHAECVAGGGEFLSQVWVLLGHMGCGEQSDSAVGKKIERSAEGERRERNERRERRRVEHRRLEQEQEHRKRRRVEQQQEQQHEGNIEQQQECREGLGIEQEGESKRRESMEFLEQERMHS